MSRFVKSAVLSVGLAAGVAFAAQAQSGSVAALPPGAAPAAAAPLGPINPYPGPNPGTGAGAPMGQSQAAVAPSPAYVGPNPGLGYYGTPETYQKPADWEQKTGLHPYTSNMGPRPH